MVLDSLVAVAVDAAVVSTSPIHPQYRQLSSGMLVGSLQFSNVIPVQEGYSYLLRSIGYEHSDVLVAFKVLRKDFDGSVVLQWKLLKQYPAPHLDRSPAN